MRFPYPEASTMRLQPRVRACAGPFACLLAALAAPAAANDAVFVSDFESVWVLGYHVGYEASDYPTDKVDFAAMSHVAIGVVTPNTDGIRPTSTMSTQPADLPGPAESLRPRTRRTARRC